MQLNLRDLFWLIFVAAIATMWWMDRSKLADRLSFYEMPQPQQMLPPRATVAPPLVMPPLGPDPFGMPPPPPGSVLPSQVDPLAPAPKPSAPVVDPFS